MRLSTTYSPERAHIDERVHIDRAAVATSPSTAQQFFRRLKYIVAFADLCVINLSLLVSWIISEELGSSERSSASQGEWIQDTVWLLIPWLAYLAIRGAYSPRLFGVGPEEFQIVSMSSVLAAGTVGLTCYLTNDNLSREYLVLAYSLGWPLLLIERYAVRAHVHRLRQHGRFLHRVIAVGGPNAVRELVNILKRERYVGYEVVGACVPDHTPAAVEEVPVPILGTARDSKTACDTVGADTVIVTDGSFSSSEDLRRVAWQLEGSPIDLIILPSLADVAGPRIRMRPVAGLPLMHVEAPQADAAGRWKKRLFDLVGAGLALLLLTPLMFAVACLIKLEDHGPILFRQPRVGRGGAVLFECLKFRSMCIDAESRLAEVKHLNESDGVLFKLRADPRCTQIGRILRRYSLDELPQLVNVMRGHMSLVGPRPPLPGEVEIYGDDVRRRLLVRPGLTGLWQVSGRSELSWRESVRLDLYYVDNWSMVGDLIILAKTWRAVLTSTGAY